MPMQVFFGPFSRAPHGVPIAHCLKSQCNYPLSHLHHVKADKENAKDGDGEEACGKGLWPFHASEFAWQ